MSLCLCVTSSLCLYIIASFRLCGITSVRHCVTASFCLYVTASLYHCVIASLLPYVITSPCHYVSTSPRHCVSASISHCVAARLCHYVSMSVRLCVIVSLRICVVTTLCHCACVDFDLALFVLWITCVYKYVCLFTLLFNIYYAKQCYIIIVIVQHYLPTNQLFACLLSVHTYMHMCVLSFSWSGLARFILHMFWKGIWLHQVYNICSTGCFSCLICMCFCSE